MRGKDRPLKTISESEALACTALLRLGELGYMVAT
jgi:hypothetical protein